MNAFGNNINSVSESELQKIDGIGPKMAANKKQFYKN